MSEGDKKSHCLLLHCLFLVGSLLKSVKVVLRLSLISMCVRALSLIFCCTDSFFFELHRRPFLRSGMVEPPGDKTDPPAGLKDAEVLAQDATKAKEYAEKKADEVAADAAGRGEE